MTMNLERIKQENNHSNLIKQQPHKELVKVRQFVAGWVEKNKDKLEEFLNWLDDTENNSYETLIRMKLEGYLIDNDKLYEVVFLDDGNHRLILNKAKGKLLFIDLDEDVESYHKTEFTEKRLKRSMKNIGHLQ